MKTVLPLLLLTACRLAMAASSGVIEGNTRSSVRVLIYEDLQCGDSAKFEALLEEKLIPKFGVRVAFVHRDFPLGEHAWAREAAIAGRWVYEQNPMLGLDFRNEIMSEQDNISEKNLRSWLAEFATRNRLDPKAIVASLNDIRLSAQVDQDLTTGRARGITKTSTVLVNGQTFTETIVFDDVAQAIEDALK